MIVRADRRRTGLGRLLLSSLEEWASVHGYERLWVATGDPAVGFYRRCGWQLHETLERGQRPSTTVLTKRVDHSARETKGN